METFNQVLDIIYRGVTALGVLAIVWGAVTLGGGLKDKTAPQIMQGIGEIVGGAIIILAAQLIPGITL